MILITAPNTGAGELDAGSTSAQFLPSLNEMFNKCLRIRCQIINPVPYRTADKRTRQRKDEGVDGTKKFRIQEKRCKTEARGRL